MNTIKLDYSDVKFADNGKLKLLIIVGTRPEIIRLGGRSSRNAAGISIRFWRIRGRTMTII